MKNKTKKKLIRLFSVVMILFSILNIFSNIVYADENELLDTAVDVAGNGSGYITSLLMTMGIGGSLTAVVGLPLLILNVVKIFFIVLGLILQVIISGAYSSLEGNLEWTGLNDIIFAGATNGSKFLDVNFFDLSTELPDALLTFRSSIAKWYYILRLISAAILLVILIYVGIKMALSTIASDQAKYKQMLVDWVTSLALLFLLHYIIIFVITANNSLVSALSSANDSSARMMEQLHGEMWDVGIDGIFAAIVYFIYAGQIFSFFLLYLRRMITVGFLIMIAPLITITYAIDKMGDGKAQALNNWLKELVYNILIQPFHCVLFMAFFDTIASMIEGEKFGIAEYIFAIVIMKFIKKAEDILKKIFHFESSSMSSISESGQSIMNATGKFAQIGMAAGSAASSFKAAGGIKGVKDSLKNMKRYKRLESRFAKYER